LTLPPLSELAIVLTIPLCVWLGFLLGAAWSIVRASLPVDRLGPVSTRRPLSSWPSPPKETPINPGPPSVVLTIVPPPGTPSPAIPSVRNDLRSSKLP
jgi:hypothetical protein